MARRTSRVAITVGARAFSAMSRPGHVVLFRPYTSHDVKIDGEACLIRREDDVLAVIETSDEYESGLWQNT